MHTHTHAHTHLFLNIRLIRKADFKTSTLSFDIWIIGNHNLHPYKMRELNKMDMHSFAEARQVIMWVLPWNQESHIQPYNASQALCTWRNYHKSRAWTGRDGCLSGHCRNFLAWLCRGLEMFASWPMFIGFSWSNPSVFSQWMSKWVPLMSLTSNVLK